MSPPCGSFPIIGHFDIVRSYNAATGKEQRRDGKYDGSPVAWRDFFRVNGLTSESATSTFP